MPLVNPAGKVSLQEARGKVNSYLQAYWTTREVEWNVGSRIPD